MEFISQPWHWAVSGAALALIVFILTWMGQNFGISGSFKTICAITGVGKKVPFFDINWKNEFWKIAFAAGAIVGGYIASHYLQSPEPVAISQSTITHLSDWGIEYPKNLEEGAGMIPTGILNFSNPLGIMIAIIGGFLVGFGARYSNGCTSGHAITGISHLQLPSLLTVIGFFIGGLLMTFLIMPFLFG